MTKKLRQLVYDKFGGRCAYTGQPLDEKWQVDHVSPKRCWRFLIRNEDGSMMHNPNEESNLFPAIRIINHYKREKDLEDFRRYMLTFHERIAKLPKKTRVEKTTKRKAYMLEVASLFGITPDTPFSGKFYFETINQNQ